nr:HipA domain-containing protein [Rufibacter sp. XAAS-G3-1]
MKNSRCLYCYQELKVTETEYHPKCSKSIYGTPIPPELPYTDTDMFALAEQIIKNQTTITGVQPKLSLSIEALRDNFSSKKFAIVGLWGDYILKPQTQHYRHLPEIEDVTMHLAALAKVKTVNHSLIRLASGQLAYITKRVDRSKNLKLHMEDMCQLTERLTEHKYKGSYEQIAKVILKHTANPGFDSISFYEQVLFSFLTGNNDMHLKNFSLLKDPNQQYHLCPAYDLVASELVVEGDTEELALTLNGKKRKLKRKDFEIAMGAAGIEARAMQNIFKRFSKALPAWHNFIDISFLPEDLKTNYHELLEVKQRQLEISS